MQMPPWHGGPTRNGGTIARPLSGDYARQSGPLITGLGPSESRTRDPAS